MTRQRLKALGLSLIGACALGVAAAPAAPAASFHSGSASGTTFLTVEQVGVNSLDTPSGSVKCSKFTSRASYSGTTTSSLWMTNTSYSECTAFGLEAHVDMMSCFYESTSQSFFLVFRLNCGITGDGITITPTQGGAAICHIKIPVQEVEGIFYNRGGSPDTVEVVPKTWDTIEYTVQRTTGGAKCPTNGSHNDGVYTGALTFRAFQNSAHTEAVGLTHS